MLVHPIAIKCTAWGIMREPMHHNRGGTYKVHKQYPQFKPYQKIEGGLYCTIKFYAVRSVTQQKPVFMELVWDCRVSHAQLHSNHK